MCLYVCLFVCVCLWVCEYVCVSRHMPGRFGVYMYVRARSYIYTHMYVRARAYIYTHMYVRAHAYNMYVWVSRDSCPEACNCGPNVHVYVHL